MDLFEITGAFGIITSILSFSNNAALSAVCRFAMYAFWGAYVVLAIIKGVIRIRPIIWYMLAVYVIMFAAGRFFYSVGIYRSYGPGPAMYLPYCAFFYFVGYNCQNECRREANIFIKAFLYAHVVFVILKLIFIRNTEASSSGKNMSAQIIGLGIIFALYVFPLLEQKQWMRWAFLLFAIFSLFVMIQIHSRTPALAVLITTAYWLFSHRRKKRYLVLALLVVAVSIYYFNTEVGSDFLFDYLRGDKSQDELTWNTVTSGRTGLYAEVFHEILQHPLLGQGAWAYLDCFPLHVLRTGGLFATALVLPVAYGRIGRYIKLDLQQCSKYEENQQDSMIKTASLICSFYFVVSLFEGYPPLGPNVSAFMLWIMIGLTDRYREENAEQAALAAT